MILNPAIIAFLANIGTNLFFDKEKLDVRKIPLKL